MIVQVCGDRFWADQRYVGEVMDGLHRALGFTKLVEGCAPGADDAGARWAIDRDVEVDHTPAHWRHVTTGWVSLGIHPIPACPPDCQQLQGRRAGPIRNGVMLTKGPELVVAFHHDLSRSTGTADMLRQARRVAIRTLHFDGSRFDQTKALMEYNAWLA